MQRRVITIPQAKVCSQYGYRDARRGSLEGAELLAPWAGGDVTAEGDVLSLLHEKWYGPCSKQENDDRVAQRQAGSSLASTSSLQQPASGSSGSSRSRRGILQGSTSSSSSAAATSSSSLPSDNLKTDSSQHKRCSFSSKALCNPRLHSQVALADQQQSSDSSKPAGIECGIPSAQNHEQLQQGAQPSLLAVLGTWTQRMKLFAAQQVLPQDAPKPAAQCLTTNPPVNYPPDKPPSKASKPSHDSPDSWKTCHSGPTLCCSRELSAASAPVPTRAPSEHAQPFGSVQTSEDDEDQTQAAWRWRFNRRWAREQARQFQPQADVDDEDDSNWDDVLGYMGACGQPGWQLQIARSVSTDGLLSQQSEAGALLLDASAPEGSTGSSEATRKVVAMARRAQHLHQQQLLLELRAEQRWSGAGPQQAWVGSMIPAVRADHFGSYNFVLARVTPTASAGPASKQHKLVLRGQAGLSEGRLIDSLNRELVQAMSTHHLPKVGLSLLGSGTLLWGHGTDPGVQILPGRIAPGGDKEVASPTCLAQLASELLRASLPPHVPITAREGPQ